MLTVKTEKSEFKNAKSYGYVYDYIVRKGTTFAVYVTLGLEQEYISLPSYDKNTEFKKFANCTVYISQDR